MPARRKYATAADAKRAQTLRARARYQANRDAHCAAVMERCETISGRASRLLSAATSRATKLNIPMTITRAWIEERLEIGRCALTGIPFDLRTGNGRLPYSPSIDRVSAADGYTPENCRLVTTAVNLAKNVWPDGVLLEWTKALQEHHNAQRKSSDVVE